MGPPRCSVWSNHIAGVDRAERPAKLLRAALTLPRNELVNQRAQSDE